MSHETPAGISECLSQDDETDAMAARGVPPVDDRNKASAAVAAADDAILLCRTRMDATDEDDDVPAPISGVGADRNPLALREL